MATANPVKRSEIAARACAQLKETLPDLRVIALADRRAATQSLPDWFERRIHPPQDALADVYRACDFWLFTSEREGFGLPILEAMACGTPVIASPAGAAPDLIDDANGRIVNQLEPAAFADAAEGLLRRPPEEWAAMSARALETARRHGWETRYADFRRALDALYTDHKRNAAAAGLTPAASSSQPTGAAAHRR